MRSLVKLTKSKRVLQKNRLPDSSGVVGARTGYLTNENTTLVEQPWTHEAQLPSTHTIDKAACGENDISSPSQRYKNTPT